jgi:hypothetical protein
VRSCLKRHTQVNKEIKVIRHTHLYAGLFRDPNGLPVRRDVVPFLLCELWRLISFSSTLGCYNRLVDVLLTVVTSLFIQDEVRPRLTSYTFFSTATIFSRDPCCLINFKAVLGPIPTPRNKLILKLVCFYALTATFVSNDEPLIAAQ